VTGETPVHLKFGREGGVMAAAGHKYMRVCQQCEYRRPSADCICEEPCSRKECPMSGDRSDPFDYVKPAVPRFETEPEERES
jgi:hypothetical protein